MPQSPEPETADDLMAFDLSLDPPSAPEPAAAAPAPQDLGMAFDLSDISLDLDAPASPAAAPAPQAAEPASSGVDSRVSELPDLEEDGVDPFERKLELAEEFRQIGDMDGARELLQEVIARAEGAVQAKARSMLNTLT